MVLATLRALGRVLWVRLVLSGALLAVVVLVPVTAVTAFGGGLVAALLIAAAEARGPQPTAS
jgi:hypothetical protein